MQSSQCIHRIIPASREFSRREQTLTSVGAVDDHRAVFRNLRLHFIQPLIRQVHSPQEMSCLIFPLLRTSSSVNVRSPSRNCSSCCIEIVRNIFLLLKHILNLKYAGWPGHGSFLLGKKKRRQDHPTAILIRSDCSTTQSFQFF